MADKQGFLFIIKKFHNLIFDLLITINYLIICFVNFSMFTIVYINQELPMDFVILIFWEQFQCLIFVFDVKSYTFYFLIVFQ